MGLLDPIFKEVSSLLNDLVSDTKDTITRTTEPTYDLVAGTEGSSSSTEYEVNVSPPDPFKQHEIDGTTVRQGDFRVIVSADDLTEIEPTVGLDTFTRGGIQYQIVEVQPISGGDEVVAWSLHCRR